MVLVVVLVKGWLRMLVRGFAGAEVVEDWRLEERRSENGDGKLLLP